MNSVVLINALWGDLRLSMDVISFGSRMGGLDQLCVDVREVTLLASGEIEIREP